MYSPTASSKQPNMKLSNSTEIHTRLENGTIQVVNLAQVEHCFLLSVILFVPKAGKLPSNASHMFMTIARTLYEGVGFEFDWVNDRNGLSFSKFAQTASPEYRTILNSSAYDDCGSFKTSVQAFGKKTKSDIQAIQEALAFANSMYSEAYEFWLRAKHTPMHVLGQTDFYDLRSTQFLKPACGRTWVVERTMVRKVVRELDRLIDRPKARCRGVRWRPDRKHPWVAEIKLPRKKKIWIGNFDTREEAAQAYDLAALHYHADHVSVHSIMSFEQDTSISNSSQSSTLCYLPSENRVGFEKPSLRQVQGMYMYASSNQNKSRNPVIGNTESVDSNTLDAIESMESQLFDANRSCFMNNKSHEDANSIARLCMFAQDLPGKIDYPSKTNIQVQSSREKENSRSLMIQG